MSDSAQRKTRSIFKRLLRLGKRRIPQLLQQSSTECGAACLAMILNYYGSRVSVAEVSQFSNVGRDGLSARTLLRTAHAHGLRARAISVSLNDFRYVPLPAIIHWEFNHFLVVERWSPRRITVVDPAVGRRQLSPQEFNNCFTGVVILLEPGVRFAPSKRVRQLSLWSYLRSVLRLPGFLSQV